MTKIAGTVKKTNIKRQNSIRHCEALEFFFSFLLMPFCQGCLCIFVLFQLITQILQFKILFEISLEWHLHLCAPHSAPVMNHPLGSK